MRRLSQVRRAAAARPTRRAHYPPPGAAADGAIRALTTMGRMRARYGVPLGIDGGRRGRPRLRGRFRGPLLPPATGDRPGPARPACGRCASSRSPTSTWSAASARSSAGSSPSPGCAPTSSINTGDNLSDPEGVPEVLDALGPLMEFPGAYVFGSNDYYGPKLRNPARYLIEKAQGRHGLNGNAARRRRRPQPVGRPARRLRRGRLGRT